MRRGEVDGDVAGVGDAAGGLDGLGEVAEELGHLVAVLQEVGGVGHLQTVLLVDGGVGLDGEEDVLGGVLVAVDVVDVVGGDDGDVEGAAHLDELDVDPVELGHVAVALELEVEAGHALLEPQGGVAGVVVAPVAEEAGDLAVEAAGEGDHALAVLLQELAVDAGLVVVALELGLGGEVEEVAVAGLVLGEQGEVVGLLGVGQAVAAAGGGEVGLHADDGLDVGGAGLAVEVDDGVEDAVVGEADGVHAEGLGPLDELIDAAEAVEQAVLAVEVEVGERRGHVRGGLGGSEGAF